MTRGTGLALGSIWMPLQLGDVIAGKYVLRSQIGEGGMGVVFLADDRALARSVAIKVLHPRFASNELLARRFLGEAVAASRLRHPNSVAMLDCNFLSDGTPFFVMEYVHGRSLDRIIAEEQIPLPRVLAIIGQILAALEAIHMNKVVHADVASGNFIVEQLEDREHVTIIDFGLARMVESAAVFTDEHGDPLISGTPEYMAPEIVCGHAPTPSSDLYGAGVILYELLTGTAPFRGRSPSDVMARHLDQLVVPPSRLRPDREIRASFDRLLLKALAKRPEARFTDAAAFARAVRDASHVPTRSTRARIARPSRSRDVGIELRRAIGEALVQGDIARIADGYLRLAQELLRVHRVRDAIHELEEGIDVAMGGDGPTAVDAPSVVAPLVAALAAVHEGDGHDKSAREIAAGIDRHPTLSAPAVRDSQQRGMP